MAPLLTPRCVECHSQVPFPTGHSYTYKQDDTGVEVFEMTRGTWGYCGEGRTTNGVTEGGCSLFLSVTAFESSVYHMAVLDTAAPGGTLCAEGCAWKQLGDGDCQPQCNVSSCFFDRGDCVARDGESGPHCKVDCKADWCAQAFF